MRTKLDAYIRRSLNRDTRRFPNKVRSSRAHIVADIRDGLRIMLGPDYERRLEDVMGGGSFQGSDEQRTLTSAIRSALLAPRRHSGQRSLGDHDPAGDADDLLGRMVDMVVLLEPAMNSLGEEERYLLRSCYLDGKSQRQLARQLGKPSSTINGAITRATRKMFRYLAANEGKFD